MTDPHPLCLRPERVAKMVPIVIGRAREGNSHDPGCTILTFEADAETIKVQFHDISSTILFDEVFATKEIYPYPYLVNDKYGLFECVGSSYLERIRYNNEFTGKFFASHRHFVYFDDSFYWHITALDFTLTKHRI